MNRIGLKAAIAMALFVSAITPACHAQAVPTDVGPLGAAERYIAAYERLDIDALRPLYAENVEFIDETSLGFPQPFMWSGRDAVLAGIESWKATVKHIDYDVSRMFEMEGRVVIIGTADTLSERPDGRQAAFRFHIVTVVTFKDGEVVEHRDYVDYAAAERLPLPAQG